MNKHILFIFMIVIPVTRLISQQDTTATDSLLLRQLEVQMQPPVKPQPSQAAPRSALSTNPDISAIGDFRILGTTDGQRNVELYFNSLEMQVTSVVDPYARANFIFSFGKDSLNGEYGANLEEATLTTLDLPYQLQATVGKIKPHFTKVNLLHPHSFSFVDFPLMVQRFFAEEGLFMEGISGSWLVPNPYDFYQELNIEVGRSETNNLLDNGSRNRLLSIGHLKNFFEFTDNATFELGFSGLSGVNSVQMPVTMMGIDLTYKWKPVQFNTMQSFIWQTEVISANAGNSHVYGGYTLMEYQVEKRTFLGGRFDYSAFPGNAADEVRSASLLLRFQPTEFQVLALEFQHQNYSTQSDVNLVVFRAIFGIGTHAAHTY